MNNRILAVGDTPGIYHPLENILSLKELLSGHAVAFTDDYDSLLQLPSYCMCLCYADKWKQPLGGSQAAALKTYLAHGGKLLMLHNGISLQDTPDLAEALGARFTHHPPREELLIKIMPGHPATEGIQNFFIPDEPYHFEVYGRLRVFAAYEYHGAVLPAAWESTYGDGTLMYLMPGHDEAVFQCEAYRGLIRNCVDYLLEI